MSDNESHRDHFNFSEYLLIVLALVALTLAVNNLSSGFASPLVWGGLLVTVISFVIFFKLAKQEGKPHIINISVLKNTSFNLGLLIYTFLQFIQISLTFVIPNLAQLGLKTSALTSGMLLLLGSLLSAFFGAGNGPALGQPGLQEALLNRQLPGHGRHFALHHFCPKALHCLDRDLPRHVHDRLQHDVQQLHDDRPAAAGSHAHR